jgi:hypothetical protein
LAAQQADGAALAIPSIKSEYLAFCTLTSRGVTQHEPPFGSSVVCWAAKAVEGRFYDDSPVGY